MAGRNAVSKPKAPYRDGSAQGVMSPQESVRRLAALVPP